MARHRSLALGKPDNLIQFNVHKPPIVCSNYWLGAYSNKTPDQRSLKKKREKKTLTTDVAIHYESGSKYTKLEAVFQRTSWSKKK